MPSPEQQSPNHIPSTGTYGEAAQLNQVQAQPMKPNTPPQFQEPQAPPQEPPADNTHNVGGVEMNLNDILFGQSQRPQEPVTTGIAPRKVSEILDGFAQAGINGDDLNYVASLARALGV